MKEQRYILASASPRRKELMALLGITPVIMPAGIREQTEETRPGEMAAALSRQKALAVASAFSGGEIVIGADTCVYVPPASLPDAPQGRILGKPRTEEEAASMLALLAGHVHEVYTGVTIVKCDGKREVRTFAERTAVHVADMTKEEIAAYVSTGEVMDKAGAYGIQGMFARHVEAIEGDFYNVIGLPVARLYRELREMTAWDT